jgi:hypothetical protein
MNWRIENSRFDATYRMVDILIEPKNDSLRYSLCSPNLINYPYFILCQSKSETYGEEFMTAYNFKEMDWEDLAWAKEAKGSELEDGEMFLVHDVMGKTIIKESIFDEILFDYGVKLLDVYKNDEKIQNEYKTHFEWYYKEEWKRERASYKHYKEFPLWKDAMEYSLNKLKEKIDVKN